MTNPLQIIVIMAGGSGTRLWPLSRKHSPKQFQALISQKTLLEETYDRALKIVDAEQIYIATTEEYLSQIKELLPSVPEENILVEPLAKNTAPAIALVTALIQKQHPEAVIATIPADHVIYNEQEFIRTFKTAFEALESFSDCMITVGINPTRPDTGFGYIQMGDEKATLNNQKVFSIANFKEKPDATTAEQYLRDWAYLWNGGYFIFSAQEFNHWCKKYAPSLFESISKLVASSNKEEQLKIYQQLAAEPVEPLIIEKLPQEKRLVIPSALEWSDVGNWATLLEELQKITGTSVINGENHADVKSKNLLVKRAGKDKRFIGTIGLNDIIIVETEDALLIANKNTVATEIKDLLEVVRKEREDLL
jgi:mannose-1-phosphate guanylyltransferase